MRKLALLLIALAGVFAALPAAAQKHYESNIAVGVKGGMSLARMTFTPKIPQYWFPGMMLGVSFRYIEQTHFGLIAEVNFVQRGWKESFEKTQLEYQHRINYIMVPLLTHIYFGTARCKFFFNLGPEIGFMISNSVSSNFDYNHPEQVPEFPMDFRSIAQYQLDIARKFDYGIAAGLGFEYRTKGKSSFNLEGRYYYGIGNVFNNRKSDAFSMSSGMTIEVTLGYSFRVK